MNLSSHFTIKLDFTKQQRTRIRRLTHEYINNTLISELKEQLENLEITGFEIEFASSENSSEMVDVVNVKYQSILVDTKIISYHK